MNTLDRINATVDPDTEPYTPALSPADAIPVSPSADSGCWETHTGTHYPTLNDVPWQAQGSATLVECDGYGLAHS
jgi:hypothetical protein